VGTDESRVVQPSEDDLEELAESVTEIGNLIGGSDDFEPVVVEFAGSPKAGKSTTIEIVAHFFKRMGFSVSAPSEGASKRTPYHLRRYLVAFNAWTLNYAISELLVAFHNVDRPFLIFLDRGPFDSLAWMRVLKKRGDLADEEFGVIERFALLPKWSAIVSQLYLFTCEPDVSLERENEAKLVRRPGTAMNPTMLNDLLEEYEALAKELTGYPVKRVHTSPSTTARATSYDIAMDIRDLFQARLA
jgi:thymidylate kinase